MGSQLQPSYPQSGVQSIAALWGAVKCAHLGTFTDTGRT